MNLGQWIEHVAGRLEAAGLHFGHGTANAWDEAAWLVLQATGRSPVSDWDAGMPGPNTAQRRRVETLLTERIEKGVPLAYLLGSAWFAGLEFEVGEQVLIPRSPIAELVIEGFGPWRRPADIRRVLDLCTGSGCIGIAIAVHMPWTAVDASDISTAALGMAERNRERHGIGDRVRLVHSDLFDALGDERYDLIVSNPPYVPERGMAGLPSEYLAEPALALVSGSDGLEACLRIMVQCAIHLEDQGILVCEVGESQDALERLLPSVPFLWLEFSQGGSGVFLLDRNQLVNAQAAVERAIRERRNV